MRVDADWNCAKTGSLGEDRERGRESEGGEREAEVSGRGGAGAPATAERNV